MNELSVIELVLFIGLFSLERLKPARTFTVFKKWFAHWLQLMLFATLWLAGLLFVWPYVPAVWLPLEAWPLWQQVTVTYLTYSFVAYWYHRMRHTIPVLWRYIHYMHHAPAHMDTRVTFWRHPMEMMLDSLVIMLVGKLLGAGVEVIVCVLIVESMLEIFHHSNIHTPRRWRWVGYFIQLPEQHLIHHQRALHRWNYGTVTLWDSLFRTVQIPESWEGHVGLPEWNNTVNLLFYKY